MADKKNVKIILTALFALNLFAWIFVYDLGKPKLLEVDFLSVGQGDAIFIVTPENHKILIDGGPDNTVLQKLAERMPSYDRTLDLIILSHPEKDHLFGLIEVLKRYKVENIVWTGIVRETPEWKEWQKIIIEEEANIRIAKAKEKIIFQSKNPKIYIDILAPEESLEGQELKDSNDSSIVAKLTVGEKSLLFTGDAGEKEEKKLLEKNIDSDILKISHHGSKYSNSEDFYKGVSPWLAVIEVGVNSYGHPTQEVLASLEKFGIKIKRTDKDGDIELVSDGKDIKIKN